MDAFDTLGVPPAFELDLAALEARHRALSAALHPDRFASASAGERRIALGRAIEVNEAFRLVRDPVRRAECLLARSGIAVGDGVEPKPAPSFLLEMMELREALSEAHAARDLDGVTTLGARVREREAETLTALSTGFASKGDDASALRELLPELGKLRYFRRFFEELAAIEDDLLG